MEKSSIHFRPVKENSRAHNEREGKLDYVYSDLSKNNERWKVDEIENRQARAAAVCKELTGRKMQAAATPVREAVLNLRPDTSLQQLRELATVLKEKKGIDCFQIYIHRDEGKSREDLNHHAHMLFDWTDYKTGKSIKLKRADMSQIQTIVADHLGMQRGELKVNSNRERLEPVEYKRQQEELKLQQLQSEVKELEQKKNEAAERNRAAHRRYQEAERSSEQPRTQIQPRGDVINEIIKQGYKYEGKFTREEIRAALRRINNLLEIQQKEIEQLEGEYRELSQSSIETVLPAIQRIESSDQYRKFKWFESQITEVEADIRRAKRTIENRKSRKG